MNKDFLELKDFFLSLLAYIRPDIAIDISTPFTILKLNDIDYTLLSIECEEKYQIIVDEDLLTNFILVKDALHYLEDLIRIKKKTYYSVID